MSRRGVLGAGLAALLASATGCGRTDAPARSDLDVTRHDYGSDPSQFGQLYLPSGGGPFPVVVVIHGGFWRSAYDLSLGTPLAEDLAGRGYAAWNLEYRRLGNGGGWPATLQDVADGIDLLAELQAGGAPLDLARVATLGHSAGGHLAVWAAARPGLPADAPGAGPKVVLAGALSQAGVLDLRQAAEERLGDGATQLLLDGEPADVPDRYDVASPVERVPLGVPVVCVHGRVDTNVPPSQSQRYARAATAAGDRVEVVEVDGDHFVVIDVDNEAWTVILEKLPDLL
ncbi:MAG: alpha/beta hydrolase [Geodermatophilaceae bacterium]|nr:alpha/beta hydrolase [Geodermatophilaceae bacterium]